MIKLRRGGLLLDVFTTLAYALSIIQFLCGMVVVSVRYYLETKEAGEFVCDILQPNTREFVDGICYSSYQKHYNSPLHVRHVLPLSAFVMLSVMFQIIVVIYSRWIRHVVIYSRSTRTRLSSEPEDEAENQTRNKEIFLLSRLYFVHLVIRFLCEILFIILQFTVFFPSGFEPQFCCREPAIYSTSMLAKNANASQFNSTCISCDNLIALKKKYCSIIVSVLNTCFPFIMLIKMIYLSQRLPEFKRAVKLISSTQTAEEIDASC